MCVIKTYIKVLRTHALKINLLKGSKEEKKDAMK